MPPSRPNPTKESLLQLHGGRLQGDYVLVESGPHIGQWKVAPTGHAQRIGLVIRSGSARYLRRWNQLNQAITAALDTCNSEMEQKTGEAYVTWFTNTVYFLVEISGVPLDRVIADLKAQPRRVLSIGDARLTIMGNRDATALRKFGETFLTTWSVDKAKRSIDPTFPAVSKVDGITEMRTIRRILGPDPNWPKYAGPSDPGMPVSAGKQVRRAIEGLSCYFPRDTVAQIIRKYPEAQRHQIQDVMRHTPKVTPILAETIEGRRFLEAWGNRDVKAILKAHDWVLAIEPPETAKQTARSTTWHAKAASFVFPPGVRPLTTRAEFLQEGEEMGHCVGSYWYHLRSLCFAFLAPDGTRATLELRDEKPAGQRTPVWHVQQFYAHENTTASPACRKLLREFLRLNGLGGTPSRANPGRLR